MTSRVGLAIAAETNDLYLAADGNLALARDTLAVGQHARQRLKHFSGEWFLDTEAGVTWLDDVLGFQHDPALAEALIKAEILDTDGVTEISDFSVSFSRDTRALISSRITVLTVYEEDVTL